MGVLRLLVIEDAPDDADLLALELQRAGYEVDMRRVTDLDGMVEAFDERDWDLVVSDHSMPGMTSFDALDILRQRDLDLPFIIFSGGIGEEEAVRAMRAGAKDYVMKGNIARLIPAVARELKQAEARRERKRAEATLRELQQMREFALESARMGEWEIDIATRKFRPMLRHLRLFGLAVPPTPWDYGQALARIFVEDRPRVEDAFGRAFANADELDIEFRVVWPDLSVHWLWTRARRFEPEGQPAKLAGIIADISQRKETEAQLQQSLKMEALGQLTGGIAHDFNNLLTVILGNSGLLREELPPDGEPRELADSIHDAGRSGAELTRRLLAFARQQPLQAQRIDLAARLRDAGALLRQPLGPDIALEFDLAPELPQVAVDPTQLETALLNLVINARDAMPEGGAVSISARRAAPAGRSGDFILLAVADTGTGMPPEVAARAMEPFFTTKEVGKGTGLGLSMVYGFANQSGGELAIDTAPGRGTTIKLYLPGVSGEKSVTPAAPRPRVNRMQRRTDILVVDDDRAVRGFLVSVCRSLGHRVAAAADGVEALAALAATPQIELLLSDVAMPNGMSGYELAREARRRRPDLKILLTSGFPAREVRQRGALDPDIRILQKPYDGDELAAAIAQTLSDAHADAVARRAGAAPQPNSLGR